MKDLYKLVVQKSEQCMSALERMTYELNKQRDLHLHIVHKLDQLAKTQGQATKLATVKRGFPSKKCTNERLVLVGGSFLPESVNLTHRRYFAANRETDHIKNQGMELEGLIFSSDDDQNFGCFEDFNEKPVFN